MLSALQLRQFAQNGFLILPQLASPEYCQNVLNLTLQHLSDAIQPMELEADTGYPGAPTSIQSEGGQTVRRLLGASMRDTLISDWATGLALSAPLHQLLGKDARLSQAHHNCIMTKQPRFSSITGWHRDSRYWHFERAELISAWLALGNETVENGCLMVIPGSHRVDIASTALDAAQFLRTDLPENQHLLDQAIAVPLRMGDVLLFSSNLFHAAGKNYTDQTKFSMVFTYRASDNLPLPDSRSTSLPELALKAHL